MTGLFYGGGASQLVAQIIGSGATTIATFIVAYVVMLAVKATGTLRVSAAGEIEGLDIHEHGAPAYPEYVLKGNDGTPKSLDAVPKGAFAGRASATAAGD